MKKIVFLGILIIALFLTAGLGCTKSKDKIDAVTAPEESDVIGKDDSKAIEGFEEGRILVDRVRYVQASNPPFDFTNVIFHQKTGSAYRAEISSDKDIKAEVMTDKDCLLKGQGNEYNIISEDEGKEITIIGEKNEGENRNLCIGATAAGNGQVEIKFKVIELV